MRLSLPAAAAAASAPPDREKAPPTVEAQLRITCAPSQHTSGRTGLDRWAALWAAWVVEELLPPAAPSSSSAASSAVAPPSPSSAATTVAAADADAPAPVIWADVGRKVYFAGDTGYRTVRPARCDAGSGGKEVEGASEEERMEALERAAPCCPAFREVGERFGGVDVALVPIGCVCAVFADNGVFRLSFCFVFADL